LRVNRESKLLLPTPESPISTTVTIHNHQQLQTVFQIIKQSKANQNQKQIMGADQNLYVNEFIL